MSIVTEQVVVIPERPFVAPAVAGQMVDTLEVEEVDVNLYRSKKLSVRPNTTGVFGGQVVSQALVSATQSVDPAYALHSFHCYFMLAATAKVPIVYQIDRVRDGRSYVTRSVRASQRGRTLFVMLCSFQRPEPRQPQFQWPMPAGVPSPDVCESLEDIYAKLLRQAKDERTKQGRQAWLDEYKRSPLSIKDAGRREVRDGLVMLLFWFKTKNEPMKHGPATQKAILTYMSDSHFLVGIQRTFNYVNAGKPSGNAMQTSLDHNAYFYSDDFDTADWLLYTVVSERMAGGRGTVHGKMYTAAGDLVAVTYQEGLIRVANDAAEQVRVKL